MKTNYEVIHELTSIDPNLNFRSGSLSLSHIENNKIALYSYSTIIAIRDNNNYLINDRTYSRTTSNHQSLLRGAVYNPIYVYDVNLSNIENLSYYIEDLKGLALKQHNARKRDYTSYIKSTLKNLNKFINYVNFDKRNKLVRYAIKLTKFEDTQELQNFLLSEIKLDAEKVKKANIKRLIKQINENKKIIKLITKTNYVQTLLDNARYYFQKNDKEDFRKNWGDFNKIQNKINHLEIKGAYHFLNIGDILRVNNNNDIVTSQNVIIKKDEAIKLYFAIIKNKIKKGDIVLNWRCINVNKNFIEVGCHKISIEDIKNAYNLIIKG